MEETLRCPLIGLSFCCTAIFSPYDAVEELLTQGQMMQILSGVRGRQDDGEVAGEARACDKPSFFALQLQSA
jgi:hypothetical protein